MSNITKLYPSNAADKADNVIEQAIGSYESILMIGYDNEGILDVRASTNIDRANLLWIIEQAKLVVMDLTDNG